MNLDNEDYFESSIQEENSTPQKDTKYILMPDGSKKYKKSKVDRICIYCGKTFSTKKAGKTTAIFCSRSCASTSVNSRPDVIQKRKDLHPVILVEKKCAYCGESFTHKSHGKKSAKIRFCSQSCSAKWRVRQPEIILSSRSEQKIEKLRVSTTKQMLDPVLRKMHSDRMKLNNPMQMPGIIEKVSAKLKGRAFKNRGGNGQLTIPQLSLWRELNLPESALEYPIATSSVKHLYQHIPGCYKSDIAIPDIFLSIEVDGMSHGTTKVKALDKLKTEVLNSLGWRVVRFTNKEILENLPMVIGIIRQYMTSK